MTSALWSSSIPRNTAGPILTSCPARSCSRRSSSSSARANSESKRTTTRRCGTRTSSISSKRRRSSRPCARLRARRAGLAMGHVADLRVCRDPRLLWLAVLVHLAGHRARPRPDLDERQRAAQAAGSQGPRGGRHLRVRAIGERARSGRLLDGHDPHAPGRRHVHRERAASTTSATATRRPSCRPSASSRIR